MNGLNALTGGAELEVEHIDGRRETVKVRQLPLRLMAAYGDAQRNEERLCALFCDRPNEWADSLRLESAEAVVELGDRLNLDAFFRWAKRRKAASDRLAPLADRHAGRGGSLRHQGGRHAPAVYAGSGLASIAFPRDAHEIDRWAESRNGRERIVRIVKEHALELGIPTV